MYFFRGVERRPGNDQGNISIYRFEHGWVWLIPLRDGVTSVGAVCWPDYLKQRQGDQRRNRHPFDDSSPLVACTGAQFAFDRLGQVRRRRDEHGIPVAISPPSW